MDPGVNLLIRVVLLAVLIMMGGINLAFTYVTLAKHVFN